MVWPLVWGSALLLLHVFGDTIDAYDAAARMKRFKLNVNADIKKRADACGGCIKHM